MATILLIRHGENDWVKEGRLAGWILGVHLNETGERQAAEAAGRLSELSVAALYSSPVERCLETATIMGAHLQLPVQTLEALGEVRYGEWEGARIKELVKDPLWRVVQSTPSRMRFPGGETVREVQARAVNAVEAVNAEHDKQVVALVSHADIIKLVLAHFLGMHLDHYQRLHVAPASVSAIHLSAEGPPHVLRVNDDGPLRPPPKQEEKAEEAE